ncbi:MAG TPA: hypothetical protein PK391_12200, partial [Syntrophales bacterium]|nr:hypothetical protein [Syntrophales bacterium]
MRVKEYSARKEVLFNNRRTTITMKRNGPMQSQQKIFYGWWIVVGAFFLNFAGIGIIMNSMGVFVKPVSESMGFTRGGFTLYFTIAALA